MTHYYYLEIYDWGGMYAEVAVEFEFFPGVPADRVDPGCAPEVEIIEATVLYIEGEGYRRQRGGMGDWRKDLDRLALEYIWNLDLYDECVDCICN